MEEKRKKPSRLLNLLNNTQFIIPYFLLGCWADTASTIDAVIRDGTDREINFVARGLMENIGVYGGLAVYDSLLITTCLMASYFLDRKIFKKSKLKPSSLPIFLLGTSFYVTAIYNLMSTYH